LPLYVVVSLSGRQIGIVKIILADNNVTGSAEI
jgi:hypothetical protein